MTSSVTGALLGLVAGLGMLLVARRVPGRDPSLADRVEPYLGQYEAIAARSRRVGPVRPGDRVAAAVHQAAVWLDQLVGGDASVNRRLDQLGGGSTEAFRIEQLTWGAIGLASVLGLGLLQAVAGRPTEPLVLVVLALGAAAGAAYARDRALSRAVAQNQAVLLAEFPSVADLIALSVAAGEGVLGALDRVARSCDGLLAQEFRRTVHDTRSGTPTVVALEALADRAGLTAVRRFVDGVVMAVERGTPLADVLRAQAADVREARRHALIEIAARKEAVMMIPVVFLVLPVTVVFAMFPGFYGLTLSAP